MSGPALTRSRLTALIVAAAVLGAVAFASQAGESDGTRSAAPTPTPSPTVTSEQFCEAFTALATVRGEMLREKPGVTAVDVKTAAQEVADLAEGTDMPPLARAGLEFVTSSLLAVDDDATLEEVLLAGQGYSLEDSANADELVAYLDKTCPTG